MVVVGWDGLASKFQDEGLIIAEVRKCLLGCFTGVKRDGPFPNVLVDGVEVVLECQLDFV